MKASTWIWHGHWCQSKHFYFNRGEAICLHNVRINKKEYYGIVHVIVGRNNINDELWAIVSKEKTTLQTFAEYGLRSDGATHSLASPSKQDLLMRNQVSRASLLKVLLCRTMAQGVEVAACGKRRWVDAHWFREHSPSRYFRISWDWVKAALYHGWKLIDSVTFSANQDPSPAIASRKHHEKKLYQLEFRVLTFSYAVS